MSTALRTLSRTVAAVALLAAGLSTPAPAWAQSPDQAPIIGRWDMTVAVPGAERCGWLEVHKSGNGALVGRYVGWSGSARPVSEVELADGAFSFAIPPQWEAGDGDLVVRGTVDGDAAHGTIVVPEGRELSWTGRRAPSLERPGRPAWGDPIVLFGGDDLSRWRLPDDNQWSIVDGVLTNAAAGGNLVTRDSFTDFKLHVEFRYPENGNSGVYLRGRHEVQIEDSAPTRPQTEVLGAVYGFLEPNVNVAWGPDRWQTFDITLVGRLLTVVLNGTTVISEREIPGITGGAISCDEGAPGPLMLQGDHTAVEYRNIVLTPAK